MLNNVYTTLKAIFGIQLLLYACIGLWVLNDLGQVLSPYSMVCLLVLFLGAKVIHNQFK